MKVTASLPLTQALRIMPGVPSVFSASAADRSPPLSPLESRGPGESNWMVTAWAHRLVGGLRLSAKRPTATATRIAPGTTASSFGRTAKETGYAKHKHDIKRLANGRLY